MINIKELAKETGFSVATVSKALNDYPDVSPKTKKIIIAKAKELGYFPNSFGKNLVTKKSFTIGVVFEEQSGVGLAHPFFGEVLSIIKTQIEMHGYDMLLMSKKIGPYVRSYMDHCYQKGVDGVIVISADLDKENYLRLVESELPMVLIDFQTDIKNTVYTNNYQASFDSVSYLVKLGHQKIGYIKGDLNRFTGRERYAGFLAGCKHHGIMVNDDLIFDGRQYLFNEGEQVAGLIKQMASSPTAILCASDTLAIGLMKGLLNHGLRVPEDISIMGFDDIRMAAQVYPALTTVAQDKQAIGKRAAQKLIDQINNPHLKAEAILVDGVIIERQTVRDLTKG